jgi:hypothetical protein
MKTNWEKIADDLYKSLKRTPYHECGELDHGGDKSHYHKCDESCPVIKKIEKSIENYQKLKELKTKIQ